MTSKSAPSPLNEAPNSNFDSHFDVNPNSNSSLDLNTTPLHSPTLLDQAPPPYNVDPALDPRHQSTDSKMVENNNTNTNDDRRGEFANNNIGQGPSSSPIQAQAQAQVQDGCFGAIGVAIGRSIDNNRSTVLAVFMIFIFGLALHYIRLTVFEWHNQALR